MNFNQIYSIDPNHPSVQKYRKVSKLFLAHNHLSTLEGLEVFPKLTHLSISHNKIQDIEELSRIQEPLNLECLAVKGNFIDRHPDYKALTLQFFANLKELDGWQIGEKERR